jgi:putative ABC transport system permease protein
MKSELAVHVLALDYKGMHSRTHVVAALLAASLAIAVVSSLSAQRAKRQQTSGSTDVPAPATTSSIRTIAIEARLAADHRLRLGDTVAVSATPGSAGERVVIAAIVARGADPSEVARTDYKVRLHLDQLQRLLDYGDRVDRFAVDADPARVNDALRAINARAFGFRAHRSADVAVETSKTFAVVSRFNRAIGVITIVASAIFLLCIMLLKVEERRRDVAALRLMGISRSTVTRAIVLEASMIALLGSAAGVAFGYASSLLINAHYRGVYRTPLAFSVVTPGTVAFAVSLSLLLGIGAGALAARRLTRLPPLSLFGR